eukprot:7788518-Pyramimonas_sp.AAC.1
MGFHPDSKGLHKDPLMIALGSYRLPSGSCKRETLLDCIQGPIGFHGRSYKVPGGSYRDPIGCHR